MPEGDTVWRAATHLHRALRGSTLTASDFRVPQLAVADLTGSVVREVASRGKHLLVRLSTGQTLHSHLRMDGAWHLYRAGSPWSGGPDHSIRVVLQTSDWSAVGYRIHDLALVATADEPSLVGHLGPDLLGDDWDEPRAIAAVRADARTIGEALLEQRSLAGIGNLYKCEVLFLHGVWPWRKASDLPDVEGLVRTSRKLLLANREHVQQSTTGDLRAGRTHWVYGRAGKPCRRCGTRIQSKDQGVAPHQRITFWCPSCQPPPKS